MMLVKLSARLFRAVLMMIVFIFGMIPSLAMAQGNVSRYVYDENGRLRVVISPAGEAVAYDYDPAGNPTAVRRYTAADFAVLDFTPKTGAAGDIVQIYGVGFGASANSVAFNGVSATVDSWSATQITVRVPASATTGPISVIKTGGATAQSAGSFTIKPRLSISPDNIAVLPDSNTQFTAILLSISGTPTLVWSVNGILGGNAEVGTITGTGLYRAPVSSISPIVVRAAVSGQEQWFGEARISVTENIQFVAAPQVSVQVGAPAKSVPSLISAVKGIYISSIAPGTVQRGTSFMLTLNGRDFNGATAVQFLFPPSSSTYGQSDANVSVSNIQVNGAGTQLTATVSVNAAAVAGDRMIVVRTATDSSPISNMGVNVIRITQ